MTNLNGEILTKIRKHVFTQLHVDLLLNKIKEDEEKFEIELFSNNKISDAFFKNSKVDANSCMGCINVTPVNNGSGNIRFTGNKSDFNNIKDFKSYLKNNILDNDLSIMPLMKGNFITAFLLNKKIESEPKSYNLDKMFVIRQIDIFQDEETRSNEFKINAGHDLKFIVAEDTFVLSSARNIQGIQNYCNDNSLDNKNATTRKQKIR
jgi:hypothetical protein